MSKVIKKKFKIEGMHCSSCSLVIDMELEDSEGIKSAKSSYARQDLEVEYDPQKVSLEKILKTVKKSGYSAIPLLD